MLIDLIIKELNENLTDEQKEDGVKFERLHSEPYQIVQTKDGKFKNALGTTARPERLEE